MTQYKIKTKNHFKVLEGILFLGLFLIIAVIFLENYSDIYYVGIEFHLFIFWFFNLIPVLYLHIEYFCHNRNSVFEVDPYGERISFTNKNKSTETYDFVDLSKIVIYMPPSWHRGSRFQLLPFEQYHYARIYTKSGKEIVITCLLALRVQDAVRDIKGVSLELEKRIFASVLLDNFIERNTVRK